MAEFSNFFEDKIIDHMLRAVAFTPPATLYLALYTTAPTDAGGGTEVSGGAYARQSFTLTVASGGASSNSADITFPTATANWGTVVACAIWDNAATPNMLMWSNLDASKTVATGDTFKINAEDLDITVD